jgi:Anti-sigma factor NepR
MPERNGPAPMALSESTAAHAAHFRHLDGERPRLRWVDFMAHDTKSRPRQPGSHASSSEPGFLDPSATPRLSRSVQAQLGERLRLFYETLKLGEQPVPERFIEIIRRLEQAEPRENQS